MTASRTAYEDLLGIEKVYQATYSYDTANRLQTLAYVNSATDTIASYGMTYDDANRITAINSLTDGDTIYSYDNWYDPTIGKWISQDPIKFEAGDGNHTIHVSDPSGLEDIDPYTNLGPMSRSLALRAEESRKNGNAFGHIFYGMMLGPAALFDSVPSDIRTQAANARQSIHETIATTDSTVTKAVGWNLCGPTSYCR